MGTYKINKHNRRQHRLTRINVEQKSKGPHDTDYLIGHDVEPYNGHDECSWHQHQLQTQVWHTSWTQ